MLTTAFVGTVGWYLAKTLLESAFEDEGSPTKPTVFESIFKDKDAPYKKSVYAKYPLYKSNTHLNGVQICNNYYICNTEEYKDATFLNFLTIGSPGSNKTTSCIVPNLLNPELRGTLVVTDPSGELYELTANIQRSFGRKVYLLSMDEMCDKVNVLKELKTEEEILDYSKNLFLNANKAFNNNPVSSSDATWINMSSSLLASVLCLVKQYRSRNLNNADTVTEAISLLLSLKNDGEYEELIENYPSAKKLYLTYKAGGDNSKAKSSVILNITTKLAIFLLNNTKELTESTTIPLEKLRYEESIIYIKTSEVNALKNAPILSPIIKMLFEKFIDYSYKKKPTVREEDVLDVYFFLDEFGNIGKIDNMSQYATTLRKYKIGLYIALQSVKQLDNYYTPNEVSALKSGIAHKLFLKNNREEETSKYLNFLCGKTNVELESKNYDDFGRLQSKTVRTVEEDKIPISKAGTIKTGAGVLVIGSEEVVSIEGELVGWFKESRYLQYMDVEKASLKDFKDLATSNNLENATPLTSQILNDFRAKKDRLNKTDMSSSHSNNMSHIAKKKNILSEVAIGKEYASQNHAKLDKFIKKFIDENFESQI